MILFKNAALIIFLGALVISTFTFANDGEVEFDKNFNLLRLLKSKEFKLEVSNNNGTNLVISSLDISIRAGNSSMHCNFVSNNPLIILKSNAIVSGNFSGTNFQENKQKRSEKIEAITLPLANKLNNNSQTDFRFTCRSSSGLHNFTFQELKQALEDKGLTIKVKPRITESILQISQQTVNEGST